MPGPIQEIYPTSWDGRVIVAGGLHSVPDGFVPSEKSFTYDPATDTWTPATDLPHARHHPQLAVTTDRLYAIGGFHLENTEREWMMQADGWSRTQHGPWEPAPALPQPQAEGLMFSQNGRLHLIGGRSCRDDTTGHYEDHIDVTNHYTLEAGADAWEPASPASTARNSAAGAMVDGRYYIAGGRNMQTGLTATTEVYLPDEDRWETLKPMPQGQAGNAAGVIDGQIVVFGGEYSTPESHGVFPETWVYDPQTDDWTAGPAMPTPRHGLGAVTVDNVIYTFGGATRAGADATSAVTESLNTN